VSDYARWLIRVPMDEREEAELEPMVDAFEDELIALVAKAGSEGLLVQMDES
jgi:hypothetical protein